MSDSVKAITLTVFNSASLTSNYQVINTNGFAKPIMFMRIVNDATTAITISYDGVTDNEYIRTTDSFNFPCQANSQPNAQKALLKAGTKVYVKGTAGVGSITLSGYYV